MSNKGKGISKKIDRSVQKRVVKSPMFLGKIPVKLIREAVRKIDREKRKQK